MLEARLKTGWLYVPVPGGLVRVPIVSSVVSLFVPCFDCTDVCGSNLVYLTLIVSQGRGNDVRIQSKLSHRRRLLMLLDRSSGSLILKTWVPNIVRKERLNPGTSRNFLLVAFKYTNDSWHYKVSLPCKGVSAGRKRKSNVGVVTDRRSFTSSWMRTEYL